MRPNCNTKVFTTHFMNEWLCVSYCIMSLAPQRCLFRSAILLYLILLLYCRIHSCTAWLRAINRHYYIVYLHLIRFFVRSDDLLYTNCGRSGISAERSILIPSSRYKSWNAIHMTLCQVVLDLSFASFAVLGNAHPRC